MSIAPESRDKLLDTLVAKDARRHGGRCRPVGELHEDARAAGIDCTREDVGAAIARLDFRSKQRATAPGEHWRDLILPQPRDPFDA